MAEIHLEPVAFTVPAENVTAELVAAKDAQTAVNVTLGRSAIAEQDTRAILDAAGLAVDAFLGALGRKGTTVNVLVDPTGSYTDEDGSQRLALVIGRWSTVGAVPEIPSDEAPPADHSGETVIEPVEEVVEAEPVPAKRRRG